MKYLAITCKLFVSMVLLCCGQVELSAGDSLLFIIRVDDIMSRNETILPRSIVPFEEAVEKRGGVITWAVIPHRLIEPANEDGRLNTELRNSAAAGHEINLHGFNHICTRCGQSSHEMYCTRDNFHFDYNHQDQLIRDGLQIIADSIGAEVYSFVPPGHHADQTTYQVLLDNNLPRISTTGKFGWIYEDLFNLPPHNEFTWTLYTHNYTDRLNGALNDIKTRGEPDGYYCILLHDPFIRAGYNDGIVIDWVGELLDSLNERYGDRIRYKTLTDASHIFADKITTVRREYPELANSIKLYQNYPNPFNPSTTIEFILPEKSKMTLGVYDVLGRTIEVLINDVMDAGGHRINWKPQNLPSGLYIYRLEADGYVESKKLLYVK